MKYIQIRNIPSDKKDDSKSEPHATNMAISVSSIAGIGHFPEKKHLIIGFRDQPKYPLILKDIDNHLDLFYALAVSLSHEDPGMIDCNDYRKKVAA